MESSMKGSKLRLLSALLVLTAVMTGTQAQQRPEKGQTTDNFRLLKIQKYQVLLAASKLPCDTETQAVCLIDVEVITVDNRDYCLAVAPDLKVKTLNTGVKKTLVWKLSVSSLSGKSVAFHGKSGIVVTVDADKQIDPGGGHGNGASPIPPPTDMYFIKTKRKKLNAISGYLPVVLWGSGGDEELCAAIDPKIVNVN
jgi:hypothetical protein